ncbi:ESS family glutamate:Na+ symporter [Clostridium tetanomorphum]|uniref:Sodium/glutamate symporter n=1 Tax=Clostridium tetanomorphum TaxID=1553 RepID=A0A923E856_CLOTT|nr:sodium/glutamate symporter [Clostridium tetanomorphum]KAJ50461.1 sodium/glutamate symport carrier protein [Clostridium tetanomorphum DSM 665]MBC2398250.1 sodium/glutamate symporter [Clostridium tetanomorphum]MBP1865631.1 ESS family glutamate:Na+ symporter [Clostridium tetanomorphum]NRS85863.1 ESS family glutamate:Na+ symporter [Clostridium tetanomorphum]NRZ96129.1 ESS family glutamate:Na+ symporter [Clostridium tetanomorphum]
MKTEIIKGVLTLKIDMVSTLTLALLLLFLGNYLRKKVNFFERFCIPAPVIGGLLFSILALILKQSNIITISMDTTFQSPFMIVFFTTIGLGGSFGLVKKGGRLLLIYWLLCCILAVMQNVIGVSMAKLTGLHPLLGVLMGAVSMEGGHGAAAAFGPTVEGLGVSGATTVAVAAATFGLISGGLIGGPIAKHLIDRYNLKPTEESELESESYREIAGISEKASVTSHIFLIQLAVISVCMTIGSIACAWIAKTGTVLPGYVGAMFTAVIFRNINDKLKLVKLDFYTIDLIGDVALGIFLSMALMTLKLWELASLAGPMLIVVISQVVFISLYTIFVVFRLLGKNFDAAVMAAGMAGHGLGATPNAIANMSAVTEKYGPSTKAFLIVPLVGAFLIDLVGIPNIVYFINIFK